MAIPFVGTKLRLTEAFKKNSNINKTEVKKMKFLENKKVIKHYLN